MTETTRQRLVSRVHQAVFDKAPASELAFLISHPGGAEWRVDEGLFVAQAGGQTFSYQLVSLTVDQLVEALIDDGFSIDQQSPDFSGRSALVLVEGSGSPNVSGGNQVLAFTSLLWALLSTHAVELAAARVQVIQALRQMTIPTSDGEWLDLWGRLYASERLDGELDTPFAQRIPREAFRIRENAIGIELAVLDNTGFNVRIEEPWREIFTLDQSLLSGPDKLYDGNRFGYHVIRPVTTEAVDWPSVHRVINRNRAAGVLIVESESRFFDAIDAGDYAASSAFNRLASDGAFYEDRALLDYSAIEDVSVPNDPYFIGREFRRFNEVTLVDPQPEYDFSFTRSYRVYYLPTVYDVQTWDPTVTWININAPWNHQSTLVEFRATRSS